MRMSQTTARSKPIPTAAPLTAAMTGFAAHDFGEQGVVSFIPIAVATKLTGDPVVPALGQEDLLEVVPGTESSPRLSGPRTPSPRRPPPAEGILQLGVSLAAPHSVCLGRLMVSMSPDHGSRTGRPRSHRIHAFWPGRCEALRRQTLASLAPRPAMVVSRPDRPPRLTATVWSGAEDSGGSGAGRLYGVPGSHRTTEPWVPRSSPVSSS